MTTEAGERTLTRIGSRVAVGLRRPSLLVKLLGLVLATVVFGTVVGVLLYDTLADTEAALNDAQRANDTVAVTDRVVATMVEMETSLLGYASSRDPARLDDFRTERAAFNAELAALAASHADSAADVERLRAVGKSVDLWEQSVLTEALQARSDPGQLALLANATDILRSIRSEAQRYQQEHRDALAGIVAEGHAAATLVRQTLTVGGILLVVLVVGAAYYLARSVVRRLRRLARAAQAIGEGRLDYPMPVPPAAGDELDTLGLSFVRMRDRLRDLIGDKERALQAAQATAQDLETINARQRRFISVASHEFRTPLTGIQGFSELIRDAELTPDEVREYADDINRDAQRLARLIGEMLDLGRLESGRQQLALGPVDVNALAREAVDRTRATDDKHELRMVADAAVGTIVADSDKVTQMVTNLLSNAVKYSPQGGVVTLTTTAVDHGVEIQVADQGIGIPPDALERIFEPYTRLEDPNTRDVQGTGLGLPIVRAIAALHGGRVWAENAPGGGSIFHLVLPPAPPQAVSAS